MGFVSGLMGAGLFVGLQIRSNAMMKVPLSRGTLLIVMPADAVQTTQSMEH